MSSPRGSNSVRAGRPEKIQRSYHRSEVSDILKETQYIQFKTNDFREALSTARATLVSNYLYNKLNVKKCVRVFLILIMAFDKVSHSLFLDKIEEVSVREIALDPYLFKRFQRVRMNYTPCDCVTSSCGVPQGSTLSPSLFLIYMNNILRFCSHGGVISHADDMTNLFSGTNCEDKFWNGTSKKYRLQNNFA